MAELQRCWARGLALRDRDEAAAIQAEKDAAKARAAERVQIRAAQDKFRLERSRRKLSIWEAVFEGWPVERINQLALAETKKAAQDGTTPFRLRDSQAENGRTLLQLACWWGHVVRLCRRRRVSGLSTCCSIWSATWSRKDLTWASSTA